MPDRSVAPVYHTPGPFPFAHAVTHRYGNGAKLHLLSAGRQPLLRLEFLSLAGSRFDPEPGIAHFTSRMLGEGSDSYSSAQISELFDSHGAHLEISTGFDFVNVTVYTPARHLEKLLSVLDDLLHRPAFPEVELETMRNIQHQQLRLSLERTSVVASREFRRILFGADHPYGRLMEPEHVQQLTSGKLAQYFSDRMDRRYEMVLSGSVEDAHIEALGQYFGAVPLLEQLTPKMPLPAGETGQIRIPMEGKMQSSIRVGGLAVGKAHPDHMGLLLLIEILGGYFGSRLMQNLREEKGYTYGVHASLNTMLGSAYILIGADVGSAHTGAAIEEIRKEIDILRTEPVSEDELQQVRNYMKGTFLSDINSPFALADKFKSVYLHGLDYSYYDRYFSDIDQTGADVLMDLARRYLDPDRMTVVIAG